jgi:hypothetical protein
MVRECARSHEVAHVEVAHVEVARVEVAHVEVAHVEVAHVAGAPRRVRDKPAGVR